MPWNQRSRGGGAEDAEGGGAAMSTAPREEGPPRTARR